MKKLASLVIVLFSLALTSCSSDDSSSTVPPVIDEPQVEQLHIKFKLNNDQYSFEPSTLLSLQRNIMGESYVNDVFKGISLWMPVTPTVGTHPITDATPTDANIASLYNVEVWIADTRYPADAGSMIITEVSTEFVKGTFTCSGTDETGQPFTIINGSFKADR